MKGLSYISAIDGVLAEYRYTITEDDFVFSLEKKDGLYTFTLYNSFKQLKQVFSSEQVKALQYPYGLGTIADELEMRFLNDE